MGNPPHLVLQPTETQSPCALFITCLPDSIACFVFLNNGICGVSCA